MVRLFEVAMIYDEVLVGPASVDAGRLQDLYSGCSFSHLKLQRVDFRRYVSTVLF